MCISWTNKEITITNMHGATIKIFVFLFVNAVSNSEYTAEFFNPFSMERTLK